MAASTDPFALVVDDDPIILMDAADILADAGYRFFEAQDGRAALSLLQEHGDRVTLLFSDIEMPEMNGIALAHTVADRWPEIHIVLASGRVTPAPRELPDGATFIGKPFSKSTVIDHLARTLPDGKKPEPLKAAS